MEDKQRGSVHHLDYRKHSIPSKLYFSLFSEEEIRKLSVTEICTPLTFNALGHPLSGGLYDPKLGPVSEHSDPCGTCSKNIYTCSGHMGHIELILPVVNPMFYKAIYSIIKLACLNCFTLQITGPVRDLFIAQLQLLEEGYATEAQKAEEIVMKILWSDEPEDFDNIVSVTKTNKLEDLRGEPYNLMKKELNEYVESVLKGQGKCSGTYSSTKHIQYLKNKLLHTLPQTVKSKQKCMRCYTQIQRIIVHQNRLMTTKKSTDLENSEDGGDLSQSKKKTNTIIMPTESRSYLRKIWENDNELILALVPVLKYCKMEYPTDVFFYNIIPVPPPKTRPVNFVDGRMMEHPQTHGFKMIIQDCIVLKNIIKMMKDNDIDSLPLEGQVAIAAVRGNTPHEKLHQAWLELQSDVDHLMDNQLNQTTRGKESQGIKQIIEKKEGIIRMHMMGKRVNFAARTVITPDPNLSIDEIGVPEAFARTLTYPVPVTPWNVTQIRKMVLNGPNVHPGAVLVENEDGRITRLSAENEGQRASWAKKLLTSGKNKYSRGSKIVHRHLLNGDVLLLNRQPTLHRPSIMAHTVRILKGEKTFRLHYANCKAYNADFDGDEMNAHFPQNEVARSEGYNLLNVQHQYLVPKDGTPLSGLIQDHVIAGVMMSIRGRFFTKEEYCQLVCQALTNNLGDVKVLPPTILKPVRLWSGKQIISTVIISIIPKGRHLPNLHSSAKISEKAFVQEEPRPWQAGGEPFSNPRIMSEAEVVIRQGELLCGVLDKMHYGATPYGLVHCLYELYGGSCSSKLLSAFSKLFTAYLQKEGFTLGVEDIIVTKKADKKRNKIIKKVRQVGAEALRSALELPEAVSVEELEHKMEETLADKMTGRAIIDSSYKSKLDSFTNEINRLCLSSGLLKKFPQNNLQLMIQSGAKGSTVNSMQISCLLGQIELEGRRPPLMISGKSLPSFTRFDPQPRAGGFVDGRFMTGIRPQEFFFHCMAGREGLIDTAVKTSRSGYLQRCLVKHLEGLVVGYDMAVRDSDGSVIQFCYGEDGRDVMKATFLKKEQIPFLAENHKAIATLPVESMKDPETFEEIEKLRKKIKTWQSHNDTSVKERTSPFLKFSANLKKELTFSPKDLKKIQKSTGRTRLAKMMCQKWQEVTEDTRNRYMKKINCPDPVTSKYQSQCNFGAITEQLEKLMRDYLSSNQEQDKTEFRNMMCIKSMQTLCSPGEPVGLLAAQSIGEPSTQMTLNTFHFAGRGEMNVTLGIPRLREILMTASKSIKTPNMDIPFHPHIKHLEKKAKQLQRKLTRVCVADVLEYISVVTRLEAFSRQYAYTIRFQFLPHEAYKSQFYMTPSRILHHMEKTFFRQFLIALKKQVKLKVNIVESDSEAKGKNNTNGEDDLDVEGQYGEDEPEQSTRKGRKSGMEKNGDNSEEEEEEADDEDATMARIRTRQGEALEYEEPEEEEIEVEIIEEDEDIDKTAYSEENTPMDETTKEFSNEDTEDEDMHIKEEGQLSSVAAAAARCSKVINSVAYVTSYQYDTAKELWCEVVFGFPVAKKKMDITDLLKDVAQKSIVWEVPLIKRAVTYMNPATSLLTLKTDGINFMEMFKFSNLLDLNKLYSNDIHHMAETFGIEAARYVIVKEIQDVFKVYGITVDPRHLLLVADYMTSNGTYEPFNRKGIEDSASPLQQMTFESSINFLRSAIFNGKQDALRSPSSRLMVGQPCACGTGAFSLLQKLQIPAELHA